MSGNTRYVTGQGSVTGPNLNALVQTVSTVASLRGFNGAAGMAVMLQGVVVPGDGGAGLYYWSFGSYGDNGSTVIVPSGSAGIGAWLSASIRTQQQLSTPTVYGQTSGTTLTAASLLGAVISRTGPTGAFSDATDTAANIVAAVVNPSIGSFSWLLLLNLSSFSWTITPGSGVTMAGNLAGSDIVIVANSQRTVGVLVTGVLTPTVTILG